MKVEVEGVEFCEFSGILAGDLQSVIMQHSYLVLRCT
jgi:hypothetical protein